MKLVPTICIVMALTGVMFSAVGTMEDDEKECSEQLANLAACIPFVSGAAKQPTKQCCDDTNKVRIAQPKCLCVLIKESTDPSIGLPINTTLALQMPAACNIDAKVSECPSLLHLPADSSDAKIFKVGNENSSTSSTTNSSSDSTNSSKSPSSSTSSRENAATASANSNDGSKIACTILLMIGLMASTSFIFA